MQISQVIKSFWSARMKNDISANLQQKRLHSTTCTLQYEYTSFATMATHWVPVLADITSFAGRL